MRDKSGGPREVGWEAGRSSEEGVQGGSHPGDHSKSNASYM